MNKLVLAAGAVVAIGGGIYFSGALDRTGTDGDPMSEAARSTEETHIAWYDGTVDEAFALAKAENKPILLYWGAVWCPPCNQLKATIFKRPDFIARTNEFVAVYLDGDTDRAQRYGEKFGASGYPTLIALNPDGEEVTRIPGGMNLEAYVTVLDLALARTQPAAQLLAEILDDGRAASADDLKLLARYSWGQDGGKALGERDKREVFRRLSDMTPDAMVEEQARFDADYLAELSEQEGDLDEDVRGDAIIRAARIFGDPTRARAQPYFPTFDAADLIKKVTTEETPERAALIAGLTNCLATMGDDESYSPAGRLRVLFGEARLAKLVSEEVPEELKARVRASVDRERAGAITQYERSAVTNMAVGVLFETDQNDYAGQIMKDEIEGSTNAYYWMLDLADLAEEAEQTDEAVAWLKQAFDGAEGMATRIQWGSYYIDGLTRMSGDDAAGVEAASTSVLGELGTQGDPIYGRNKGAVKRIARALNKWAYGSDEGDESEVDRTGRPEVMATLTGQFDSICTAHFEAGDKLDACLALFRPVEA